MAVAGQKFLSTLILAPAPSWHVFLSTLFCLHTVIFLSLFLMKSYGLVKLQCLPLLHKAWPHFSPLPQEKKGSFHHQILWVFCGRVFQYLPHTHAIYIYIYSLCPITCQSIEPTEAIHYCSFFNIVYIYNITCYRYNGSFLFLLSF